LSVGIDNPLGLNDLFNLGMSQDLEFGDKRLGSHGWNGFYSIPWGYWSATLWGPQWVALVGTQLAGAAIGVKGSVATRFGAYAYDLFAGTPIYRPSGFDTARVTFGFQLSAQF
jgi:hemolysin activation/secretion protein